MENASINNTTVTTSMVNKVQEAPKEAATKPVTPPVSQNKVQEEQNTPPPRLDFTEDQNTGKNIQTVA